jgi:hypothetical protein
MRYMEIAAASKAGLRIKGKQSIISVNPTGAHEGNAVILLNSDAESVFSPQKGVVIASPGEYEVSGLKIKGIAVDGHVAFTLLVDGISVLLGTLSSLEKVHGKLSESDVVIVDVDTVLDPSFISPLSVHALVLTGAKAKEVSDTFIKDSVKVAPKFVSTRDKLPQEMETILLQ